MNPVDLRSILSKIAENDEMAFRKLFEIYSDNVFGFVFKLTHSKTLSEEAVQDVFMKIWINRETLNSIQFFPAYLLTIAKNHALNTLRRLALEEKAKHLLEKEMPYEHETGEQFVYHEHMAVLQQAVAKLPPQQQLVYKLCHREGLKYDEVAQQLNISRLTVKTHMQKALRAIKTHLQDAFCVLFFLFGEYL